MTKANPQASKENETRESVCLEIWCRESCKGREIPYTTILVVPL